ncbi:MAG: hypothetical protein AAFR52_01750 [Pseudomonadota bacterium]
MTWTPPNDYTPMPGVARELLLIAPRAGSAEFKLLVMVTQNRSATDVALTREQARMAIDERIVPTGLYPGVLAVALDPS